MKILLLFSLLGSLSTLRAQPNIILIMVDDMGFSDLGCYGGEIDTPNIDSLAANGVRFSQFYNNARCCPTRATLLTGMPPHLTGIGHMTNAPGKKPKPLEPATYQGFMSHEHQTVAELLRPAGYVTLMAGKWHLGFHQQNRWPLQRGFDRYYGCLAGATRFFHPTESRGMYRDNTSVPNPKSTTDEAFYTTDAFTDHAIKFIRENDLSTDQPFFLYLAYTAPHWPLQAFEDDIAKYRGKYKIGWDKLRDQRHQRQIELGLANPKWKLSPRPDKIPAWKTLSTQEQDLMDLKMAIYAAMVDRVDQNIGRLITSLKEQDRFDNTLIMFLSDNGACAEGGIMGRGPFEDREKRNLSTANSYGEAWANASNTPLLRYKQFAHEGGVATPFIMHWPDKIKPGTNWYQSPAHITDIAPTILELATSHASRRFPGITLEPAFENKPLERSKPICIEHQNNAFIRQGDWKLVGLGVAGQTEVDPSRWELYNLVNDRTETTNLANSESIIRDRLAAAWKQWAAKSKVFPKPSSKGNKSKK